MKLRIYFFILGGLILLASCQNEGGTVEKPEITEVSADIERVEPPNWWVGFKNYLIGSTISRTMTSIDCEPLLRQVESFN